MRVAMVQMTALRYEMESNMEKMETFISKAAEENASIVCFPELSITGYVKESPDKVAQTLDSDIVQQLKVYAGRYNTMILAGLAEKCNDKVFISHVVVTEDAVQVYRKTHLGRKEKKTFDAGEDISVFKAVENGEKVKFGIGLCYDLHYPEQVTAVALKGAKIIFAPHALPIGGKRRLAIWDKYMPARAYDNGVYVLSCNLVGFDGKKQFGGGIGVWNPKGEALVTCHEDKEMMLVVDLDMSVKCKSAKVEKITSFIEDRHMKMYLDSEGFVIESVQTS